MNPTVLPLTNYSEFEHDSIQQPTITPARVVGL